MGNSLLTGQREETGLGLYDYGARYYDPELGRFIQPDTIVPNPGDAQAFDRYAYVNNNPLKYTDPTGHCATLDNGDADWTNDGECWGLAYSIYGHGAADSNGFAQAWKISPDQWLKDIATASYATAEYLKPFQQQYVNEWCGNAGLTGQAGCGGSYVENPAPPRVIHTLPDCSKVDCTTLLINGAIVGLDKVSLYSAGGAAAAQSVAVGCAVTGLIPCVAAAESAAVTLGTVSTVASVAGTGLTAVQLVRGQATTTDLAVSVTSTILGSQTQQLLANSGASDLAANLGGSYIGAGASYLQYRYDTK